MKGLCMRLYFAILLVGLLSSQMVCAQVFEVAEDEGQNGGTPSGRASEHVVVATGFWEDWYVQMDLDMSLQNPYGYDMSKVFPNGKSFGLDIALGKWFSHQMGVRGKFNWENKLPLLENGHANWLAPFDEPGVNREKGGYVALYGDLMLNVHNFFCDYNPDRTWNLSVYPRVGLNYNFGVKKGALAAGFGIMNTYRLNERWSLVADVAYIMTGSGFVGKTDEVDGTGTGSNSNGYLSIGLGAQVELGKSKIKNETTNYTNYTNNGAAENETTNYTNYTNNGAAENETTNYANYTIDKGVLTNGIWDNWFVQAGLDMSLMNPYGCDFGKVIPKGQTFGMNVAAGKWFTPEFGARVRMQWENGLIENKSVEWLPPVDDPRQNYKEHGLIVASIEAMVNISNIIAGYNSERKWHTNGYARAGIISQFVTGSGSPLMGIGVEETYRLKDNLCLFGASGYQVSTSEGMGASTTGMEVAAGSNGFFNIDFGVRYDLGKNTWRKK